MKTLRNFFHRLLSDCKPKDEPVVLNIFSPKFYVDADRMFDGDIVYYVRSCETGQVIKAFYCDDMSYSHLCATELCDKLNEKM